MFKNNIVIKSKKKKREENNKFVKIGRRMIWRKSVALTQ
jgi:hypothetical protein